MPINPALFFIGLAIITIFGFRAFILFVIGYFIYTKFINTNLIKNNENWIENFFKKKFDEANFYDPKNKKSNKPNFKLFNQLNMNFFNPKRTIFLVTGLILLFVIIDGLVMVPAGHVAVILDRGRGVLKESLPTGLHLKIPFWQTSTIMNTQLQTYTMSIAPAEGEIYGNDAIEALTKDGQKVKVDVTVQFFLNSDKASVIYNTVGLDYTGKIVRPASRSVIRNVVTGFTSKELFQMDTRQKAQEMMISGMKENLENKNINLDDVLLRNIQFSETYLNAIEEKQVAEQKIQKAQFEKQEAEITKEKKVIEASAEAESIRLKGEALKANPSVIQFEMVQKISPNIKWGVLPEGVLPMLDMKEFQK